MKKFIVSLMAIAALGLSVQAGLVTTVVPPNSFTNLLTGFPGSLYAQQIIVSANSTNCSGLIIDTPTNSLTYVLPAYTNYTKYATNYYTYYTNYYGATTYSYTNTALATLTNTIAASTNNYPIRLGVAVLANSSTTYGVSSGLGYFFDNGIWVTNTGSGIMTITVKY